MPEADAAVLRAGQDEGQLRVKLDCTHVLRVALQRLHACLALVVPDLDQAVVGARHEVRLVAALWGKTKQTEATEAAKATKATEATKATKAVGKGWQKEEEGCMCLGVDQHEGGGRGKKKDCKRVKGEQGRGVCSHYSSQT